ncbi:LOW QUALITY PROTEIN: uncharacterized protein ColSpa_05782 [Colletotrichum spaethianum]|uniref:Uncharacterized protein n=1 Tax=Colletotrichum spaethianum TaxID=700344 RepID=A0AA37LC14_9PEZI|nr:LOW QUALITY PROTEIN: uncharacterized protein ColSpa_05782 [Colletotrichum spaethianum]GKT45601.1 LOW QUALITY PROTEIN: hypothetical protein ColSpa_05782 [Colletotrichum spaethianum]
MGRAPWVDMSLPKAGRGSSSPSRQTVWSWKVTRWTEPRMVRPAKGDQPVGTVNLNLDARSNLLVQLKDLLGVVVEAVLDVVDGQLALSHGSEQKGQRVGDANGRIRCLAQRAGELVRQATDGEDVNRAEVSPEGSLVGLRGEEGTVGEVVLRKVEREDGHVAGHLQALGLAEGNELDIVLGGDRGDVDSAVVQAGQEQDGGQVRELGVSDDRLVRGPLVEVGGHGGNLADVARQVVEGDEQRSNLTGDVADLVSVVRGGSDGEVVIAVSALLAALLGDLQGDGIRDGAGNTDGHDADHAEAGRDRGLGHSLEILAAGGGNAGNEGGNVDQARQRDGAVAGLEVAAADLKGEVTGDGLNKDLGVLDVGYQRDLVVNGHTSGLVTLAHVVGRTTVLVVGRQVDVKINHVLGQVLRQGELGALVLLLVGENLQVLNGDVVLLKEVGSTRGGEQLVAEASELVDGRQHLLLVLVGADGQENVGFGDLEAGRHQSLEVGLVLVNTEASDLSSGSHLNTQDGVGARETRETELGNLDTDAVGGDGGRGVGLERPASDGLGGHLDHVDTHDLGDEGEGSGGTDVALNDLDVVVLGNELNVERTSDVQGSTNLASGLLDSGDGLGLQILGRQDEGGVTGVDTSVLNMLGDEVANDNTVLGNGVHLNFLGILNILGDDDGVLARDLGSLGKVVLEILFRVDSVHRGTREDVRRSHQDRVGNSIAELLGLLKAGQLLPGRLVNTNGIQHTGELVTVLSVVNHLGGGTENLDAGAVQRQSDVVGGLSTHGTEDTGSVLQLVDVEDALQADNLKVELVGLVVISAHGLRVVVDHNGLEAILAEGANGADGAPVELDRGTDTVDTGAQDHDAVVLERHIALSGVVVGVSRELGSDRVDLLDKRHDASLLSQGADGNLVGAPELGELAVRETESLGLQEDVGRLGDVAGSVVGHLLGEVTQALELVEEPLVDLGELPDLLDGVARVHGVGDGEQTLVGRRLELVIDGHQRLGLVKSKVVEVNGTDGLLNGFLEASADAHDLTNTLHGRAQLSGNTGELLQVPTGHLDDNVVERGLEAGASGLGDAVGNVLEGDAETELGSDEGQGVSSSLGSKGRGSGQSGVDLDNAVLPGEGVQGILNVALSDNAQVADNVDSRSTKHVVVFVRQGLRGSNNDGVTSVNTERVKVLHIAHRDAVVLGITNDLVLNLLPALHTALDEHLRAGSEGLVAEVEQLGLVVGEATAKTTKSVGSSDNDGEANVLDAGHGLVNVAGRGRLGALLADGVHAAGEELAVFGGDDGINGGTQDLDAELLELVLELDTDLQSGLSTECDIDGIRSLVLDDLADEFGVDREEVHLVGETLGRLDGSNVGVDEDSVDALLFQGLDGLRAGVVELSSLSDAETTTAQDEHLAGVDAGVETLVLLDGATGEADGGVEQLGIGGAVLDGADEDIEEVLGVARSRCALGVELHTEVGLRQVGNTLVAAVVGVHEELPPVGSQGLGVDGEAVVLGGDVALSGDHARARDVVASVAELHLLGLGPRGAGEQLVAQANTKDRGLGLVHGSLDVLDGGLEHGRVTRAVGEEETVVLLAGLLHQVGQTKTSTPRFRKHLNWLYFIPTSRHSTRMGLPDGCFFTATLEGGLYSLGALMDTKIEDEQRPDQGISARLTLSYEVLFIGVHPVYCLEVVKGERGNTINVAVGGAVSEGLLLQQQTAEGAALRPQTLGKGSGIDAVDGRDALLLEPGAERGLGQEVGVVLARVRVGDETGDVDLRGLEMGGQVTQELVDGLARGHTVVTDQREGDDENLATV